MFGSFEGAVLALVFFLFGIFAGVGLGERLAARCVTKREYVLANVATLLVGAVVSAIVMITPYPMFVTLAIGVIGGTELHHSVDFLEERGYICGHGYRIVGLRPAHRAEIHRSLSYQPSEAGR